MKNLAILVLIIFGVINLDCSKSSSINETVEEGKSQQGKMLLKIDRENMPLDVTEIKASLSKNGYETLQSSMNILSDSTADLTLDDITPGTWHLKVDAENSDDLIIYTGESDVEVLEGTTVQVSLTLLPTGAGTGNIYVVVGWGRTKTLTLQPDGETGKDALLSYLNGNVNFAVNYPDFIIFSGEGDYVDIKKYRDIIQFDLTSLPKGTRIKSAYLSMYYNSTTGFGWGGQGHSGENSFFIERIINPWNESTVTWNEQPGTTSLNRVTVPKSIDPYCDYLNMNVTRLIQDMVDDPEHSFGFMFKLVNETPTAQVILYSSDCPVPSKRPKLVINYY